MQRVDDRSLHRSRDQSVRPTRRSDPECARAECQYDRRSPGFELVHQPHPGAAADPRTSCRAAPSPAADRRLGLERGLAEARRRSRRVHDARRAAAISGSCRSTPRAIPKRPPAPSSWRTRSSGRSGTGRSRTISFAVTAGSARDRRHGGVHAALGTRAPDGAARPGRRLRARAPERRRQLSRRRRARRAGPSDRRVPLLRHAARRPERRRPARASARAARAQGVRRVDQPGGHEGGQHARHRDHRERAQRGAALPAGCRVHVRHRRQRPARVRRRVGVCSTTAS